MDREMAETADARLRDASPFDGVLCPGADG